MPFLVKEIIKYVVFIFLLTIISYYFVETRLSTAFKVALATQVVSFMFNLKKIKEANKANKIQ